MAIQSENEFFFFSVSGKVFFVTTLLSSVFMRIDSSAHIFGRFQGVKEMHKFYPVDTVKLTVP